MSPKDDPARQHPDTYPERFIQRLLFADMDGFRHVNNGALGRCFEEGRADLNMKVFGPDCLVDPKGGFQPLFARISIDYLAPAQYPGQVEIGTGVSRIGNTSCVEAQAAFQDGRCVALSETVVVKAIDGRPTRFSDDERAALERFLLRGVVRGG